MIFEKMKGKRRIVKLGKDDWFETKNGVKFPIKNKPMIFGDLHQSYNDNLERLTKIETEREKGSTDFDINEYVETVNNYIDEFYLIIKTITEFNGFDVDVEFIKSNLDYEDPYWYMQSVSLGRPVYSVDEYMVKKKL